MFFSIILLAALIFAFVLFGIVGTKVVFGLIIVSLSFYLILNNFELAESEKIIFSILLGLTIFPSLSYLLGFVMPFKMAIAITFILFTGAAFALKKYKANKP